MVYSPPNTLAEYSNDSSRSGGSTLQSPAGRVPRYTLTNPSIISRLAKSSFDQETKRHVERVDVYDYNDVQLTLRGDNRNSPRTIVPAKYIHWNTRFDYPRRAMRFMIKELPDGSFEFDGSKSIIILRGHDTPRGGMYVLCWTPIYNANNIDTDYGYKEIHQAAMSGDIAQMKRIINNTQNDMGDIDVRDNLDQTALVLAFNGAIKQKAGNPGKYSEIMHMLIKAGAAVEMPHITFRHMFLECVCGFLGDIETLKLLVERGVEVTNHVDYKRKATPLHYAAAFNRNEILLYLIGIGHAIDSEDYDGLTPLSYASSRGHTKAMKTLLDKGADPNKIRLEIRQKLSADLLQLLDSYCR